jgi:hypothetical protein
MRNRRRLAAFMAMLGPLLLVSCSESIQVLVQHACPTPISVSITDGDFRQDPISIDPDTTTELYGICCEPGQDGELILKAGEWTQTVTYDRLRDDPLVTLPPEACTAA